MKRLITTIMIITLLSLNGCKQSYEVDNSNTETVQMSIEEKAFLKELYIDEDRIEDGKLYSYQKKTLDQYRFALNYLANKYPSYTFDIIYCSPMNVYNTYCQMFFEERSMEDTYEICISYKDDKLEAEDNFYGGLIQNEYDTILMEYMSDIDNIVDISSTISSIQGREFDENLRAIDIIGKDDVHTGVTTTISIVDNYMTEDNWKLIIESIKSIITNNNIYGYYIIRCYNSINDMNNYEYNYKETFENYT